MKKQTFWLVITLFLFVLLLFPGIPYLLVLLPLLAVFFFIAVFYPQVGLVFIAFTHSFTSIIRLKDQEALLLAGFGTILLVIYFTGVIIRGLLLPYQLHKRSVMNDWSVIKTMLPVWFMFLALIFFNVIYNWSGIFSTFMKFREYIFPLLMLPFAVSVLSKKPESGRSLLVALLLGSATIGLISILHYFIGLPINLPRWVTYFDVSTGISTDLIEYRQIFGGILIPRMKPLLGLTGTGAEAAYFTTMALMGCYLAKHFPKKIYRYILYIGCILNLVAAFFALSFSSVVVFICVSAYFISALMEKNIKSIVRVSATCLLMIILITLMSPSLSSLHVGLFGYVHQILFNNVIPALTDFDQLLLGIGLGLKSGGLVNLADLALSAKYMFITDQWLLVTLYQMGILGFLLTIAFFVIPLLISIWAFHRFKTDDMRHLILSAGIIVAGFIGFVHGAAPIERLFSIPMVIAIAVILVSSNELLGKKL